MIRNKHFLSAFFCLYFCVAGLSQAVAQTETVVKGIRIENMGSGRIEKTFVQAYITLKPGAKLNRLAISNDIKALIASGRFSNVRVESEKTDDGVIVIYRLENKYRLIGPVNIRIIGKRRYKESKILDWLELEDGDLIDDQVLGLAAQRIEEEYRNSYFSDAEVKWQIQEKVRAEGTATVSIEVYEGKKARVQRVIFEGNTKLPEKDLRRYAKLFRWWNPFRVFRKRRYEQGELEVIRTGVKNGYRSTGFLDARVKYPEARLNEDDNLDIVVKVHEGVAYQFGKISLRGITLFPEGELLELLRPMKIRTGDVASEVIIGKAARALKNFYGHRGYVRTGVSPLRDPDEAAGTVDIEFLISEGRLTRIRNIRIRGNTRTRDKVVRRELLVAPGDVFDEVSIKQSERIIRNLGHFSDVRSYPVETGVDGEDDLIIELEEKSTGNFMMGIAFTSEEDLSGSIEITQGNFDLLGWPYITGGGQKLKLSAAVGEKTRKYQFIYTEPWFLNRPLSLGFELYRKEREYTDYEDKRTGGAVKLSKRLPGRGNRVSLRYELEESVISDVGDTNIYVYVDSSEENFSFEQDEDAVKSSLGMILDHNTYNHFLTPTKGNRLKFSANVSGGPLGFDTDIYELSLSAGHFSSPWLKHVFSARASYEVVEQYGDTDEVPFSEHLFAGGSRSVRGYRYRDLGPKVMRTTTGTDGIDVTTYKPVGGLTRALATAEYTIPLVKMVRFAAFYDIGNVWADAYDFEPDRIASGAGVGIRLDFPSFPIRFDWGWPIEKDDEHTREDKFTFWIGRDF